MSAQFAANASRESERPFYLMCGFRKPHAPWQAPQRMYDLYDEDTIEIATHKVSLLLHLHLLLLAPFRSAACGCAQSPCPKHVEMLPLPTHLAAPFLRPPLSPVSARCCRPTPTRSPGPTSSLSSSRTAQASATIRSRPCRTGSCAISGTPTTHRPRVSDPATPHGAAPIPPS